MARFNSPTGIAVDRNGTVYVGDYDNGTIRTISPAGVVSTLAGKAGSFGSTDGVGSAARFGRFSLTLPAGLVGLARLPFEQLGVAVEGDGTVIVADAANSRLRRISSSGAVTTIVGRTASADPASTDLVEATFSTPTGVALEPGGSVIIADYFSRMVRRLSAANLVSTVAGASETKKASDGRGGTIEVAVDPVDGNGADARFFGPIAVAATAQSHLFVADNNAVRRISAEGVVTTVLSHPISTLPSPTYSGIAVDGDGSVFLSDMGRGRILKLGPANSSVTIAGDGANPPAGQGIPPSILGPTGIAVDRTGNLYVATRYNHTVLKGLRVNAPAFSIQPQNQSVEAGRTVTLSVVVSSAVTPSIQWLKDGVVLNGATSASLTIPNLQTAGAGAYACRATNPAGTTQSASANISVAVSAAAPAIVTHPLPQSVLGGQNVTLTAAASGTAPFSYQWQKDGISLPGATNATLTIDSAQAGDAGRYAVAVRNAGGTTTSNAVDVAVNTSRIANLSIRTNLGPAAPLLTVGFVVAGSGKALLLRGAGPVLGQFGLAGALTDPHLTLYAGNAVTGSNDDWSRAANAADVAATAGAVGAFAFPANSADAALLATLGGGAYSAQIGGPAEAGGVVLVELYDAAPTAASRLVNVSARAQVGTGDNILVAGFVITGNAPRTLLIRGIGPTLAAFGVSGTLSDPKIEIFRAGTDTPVAVNDNWGSGTDGLSAVFASLGAFPLAAPDSKDAAVRVTLPPGSYSAQVAGVDGATGEALVEIYEVRD